MRVNAADVAKWCSVLRIGYLPHDIPAQIFKWCFEAYEWDDLWIYDEPGGDCFLGRGFAFDRLSSDLSGCASPFDEIADLLEAVYLLEVLE